MNREREVTLRLRSPVWMGGVRGADPKVCETGVLGSLRFWYGGYCRGMGEVCDGGNECRCAVCELFGRTDHARRFSVRLEGLRPLRELAMAEQERWKATAFDPHLWELGLSRWAFVPRENDQFRACLVAREGAPPGTLDTVAGLLALISEIGGLGAKTQYGCGQFQVVSPVKALPVTTDKGSADRDEFTLSAARFRCRRYSISDRTMASYQPRLTLRHALRTYLDADADVVLGTRKYYEDQQPRASRVHISNLLPSAGASNRREFKIWFDVRYPAKIQTVIEAELKNMGIDWERDWSWP